MPRLGNLDSDSDRKVKKRVNRRHFLKATGVSAIAVTAGCSGGDDDGEDGTTPSDGSDGGTTSPNVSGPIRIGGLFPMPGQYPGGTGMQRASELRVKQLNSDGGLLGAEVQLVTRDTKLDPSTARTEYRELALEEEVDMTTGIFSSEVGTAVFDELPNFERIHVAGGSSLDQLLKRVKDDYEKYKYWFTSLWSATNLGRNLANLADSKWEDWGYERIGVAVEDIEGFTNGITPPAVNNLPDFVDIRFQVNFSSDTTNFAPIIDQAESEDVDLLFAFMANGGSTLTTQWAKRKPSFALGGLDSFSGMPSRWSQTNGQTEFVWSQVPGSGPGFAANEATTAFVEAYRSEFGSPPAHNQAYSQYQAVTSLTTAIREAGSLNQDDIISYMESDLDYDGVMGRLNYQGLDGEFPHSPEYGADFSRPPVIQWQESDGGGAQVGLWPDNVKSGDYQAPSWL